MKKLKTQEGITLVALIITIVVLLILAGVAITSALNIGLFKSAQNAKTEWELAQVDEQTALDKYLEEIKNPGSGSISMLEGDGQTYYTLAPSTLSFRSSADINDFQEVQVNGQTIDASNYTITEGSTIISLSIDYLKTLEENNYSLSIVSNTGSPIAKFAVVEPNTNTHGFYYNQPYTAYVDEITTYVFFFREDNTMELLEMNSTYSEICNYSINGNNLTVDTSLGVFNGEIMSESNIYFNELNLMFELGNESIFADEDYIYYKSDDDSSGFEVNAINKNKSSYNDIKKNINGIPVVSIERAFLSCDNMENIPQIPDTVWNIIESFAGCSKIKYAEIPFGVTKISDGAFSMCTSLEEIFIHKNVTHIYSSAFSGCKKLEKIIFGGTVKEWNAITKSSGWKDQEVPATEVICCDGKVTL